ncbi:pentapeptide repeat-containing protein [Sunxiuqinia sp. sy24]|uniref:pentapeptide repeat-containing protein n=1 Tax=Sunxiuqinia sp. sy24 TaxID=3461495 RepID=UPI004045418E
MLEFANYDKIYRQVDFSEETLAGKEFDGCQFINCSFTKCDLTQTEFLNCSFEACTIMMVILNATGLKDVRMKGCKLTGFDFSLCNDFLFQLDFDSCRLDYALFTGKKMRKTRFVSCSIVQADFSECDLTEAVFDDCLLSGTTFYRTQLEKADFRTASDFSFDPDENRIKKARFSKDGLPGLLQKYNIRIEH